MVRTPIFATELVPTACPAAGQAAALPSPARTIHLALAGYRSGNVHAVCEGFACERCQSFDCWSSTVRELTPDEDVVAA